MARTIKDWLDNLDLGKYLGAFSENEVLLGDLAELTDADLKEMGLPIGPRRRVLKAIADISSGNNADRAAPSQTIDGTHSQASAHEVVAERRSLTVLFCDLVGSTELSRKLDPEDLREVMRQYQNMVAGAITRYGGHVAKYLGDGVLAYFGWPQAYEDQAARAVRAGLDMVAATNNLKNPILAGQSLMVRVGIATGAVVVGDLSGEADAIVGETPNLAARLQGAAEPNQVLIGEVTARLVEHEFELSAMGETNLKGFDQATTAFQVSGARSSESRFAAMHRNRDLEVFVGRQAELGLIRQSWDLAKSGEGQVVLLGGEAGIGKSRLIQEFREGLAAEVCEILNYQCAPYHANSMLYPLMQQTELKAQLADAQSNDEKLVRLEKLLAHRAGDLAETIPLYAELLNIKTDGRYDTLDVAPERRKSQILTMLANQLFAAAEKTPVAIFFEDLHLD